MLKRFQILLLLLFLGNSLLINAQTAEELCLKNYQFADELYSSKSYDSAYVFFKRGLEVSQNKLSDTSNIIANFWFGLAAAQHATDRIEESKESFNEFIKFSERKYGLNTYILASAHNEVAQFTRVAFGEEYCLNHLLIIRSILSQFGEKYKLDNAHNEFQIGSSLYQLKRYPEAISSFEKSLSVYEQILGLKHEYYSLVLDQLYESYFKTKDYKQRLRILKLQLKVIEATEGRSNSNYLKKQNEIAKIYFSYFKYNKAIQMYFSMLEVSKSYNGIKHLDNANIYHGLALSYKRSNQLGKALQYYNKALLLYEELNLSESYQYARTYGNIGKLYEKKGDFEEAENRIKRSVEMMEQIHGKVHPNYISWLGSLGSIQFKRGEIKDAARTYGQVLYYINKDVNRSREEYSTELHNVAYMFRLVGRFDSALVVSNEVLQIIIKKHGKGHMEYANINNNLGTLFISLGDYEKAEKHFKIAIDVTRKIVGDSHTRYANRLHNIADLYLRSKDFQKCISYCNKSMKIITKNLGENNVYRAKLLASLGSAYQGLDSLEKALQLSKESARLTESLNKKSHLNIYRQQQIANILSTMGRYDEAHQYFQKALSLAETHLGKKHYQYATTLQLLGKNEWNRGSFESALTKGKQALQILENSVGVEHHEYANQLRKMAYYYKELGQYQKALNYYNKSLAIYKDIFGEFSPNYASVLKSRASLYHLLGSLPDSYKDYILSAKIYKKVYGIKSSTYAMLINDIAVLYKTNREYEKALKYQRIATKYLGLTLGKEHIAYVNSVINLSSLYRILKRQTEAKYWFGVLEDFTKGSIGPNHYKYGRIQISLGAYYSSINETNKSIDAYLLAQESILKYYGPTSKLYKDCLDNLMMVYRKVGQNQKGIECLVQSNKIRFKEIEEIFNFRSENEKKKFLKRVLPHFSINQSFAKDLGGTNNQLNVVNYNNQLILKSLLLNRTKDVLTKLRSLNDEGISSKIQQYQSLKNQIANSKGIDPKQIKKMQSRLNELDGELNQLYSKNFKDRTSLQYSWKDVQAQLKEGEIALEFSHFQYRSAQKWHDSTYYVVYMVKRGWEYPKMITLFEERELKSLLNSKSPNKIFETRGAKVVSQGPVSSEEIYRIIWSPIEPYLANVNKIYFTPDGLLHQIPFAALSKDSVLLVDQFQLVQLSSSTKIHSSNNSAKFNSAIIVGGVNYDLSEDGSKPNEKHWSYLPGTLEELKLVEPILKTKLPEVTSWTGGNANEKVFKELNNTSPNLIHIATHGFFFENIKDSISDEESVFESYKDPLLRSGLLFAGANHFWTNNTQNINSEDGIISALEISQLNLSNTKMVVLSACETGLGDVQGNEGVYGLQRAFKMAGVDLIVMSLWEVPDKETSEFMELFYKEWLKETNVKVAFQGAQRRMKEKYRFEPLKWAAFVLVE